MFVVSQDGCSVVMGNTVTQFRISKDEHDQKWHLYADTIGTNVADLGKFDTEDRAKEVLKIFCTLEDGTYIPKQ